MANANTTLALTLGAGGGLALWYLLRKKRGTDLASALTAPASSSAPKAPCRVWIRKAGVELDGAPADVTTVITRCREAGQADVRATGDAITQSIADVIRALRRAKVVVNASPDLVQLVARFPESAR